MILRVFSAILLSSLIASCQPIDEEPLKPKAEIDAHVKELMQSNDIQGFAVSVIEGGQVQFVSTYGWRNAEKRLPLTDSTVMYGASLTKTAFTYMVMQLVDENRLNLDTPIVELLPNPLPTYEDYTDLAGDDRWKLLTPRMLLTHRSGFANLRWLSEDGRLRFYRDPGVKYGYSGEGFYLMQLVVEEGLGLDVGSEMQSRIFDRFRMTNSSMNWRPDFRENLADGYRIDGSFEPHDERTYISAAGSMDTTPADQALMWAAIVRGDGLSAAARKELVRPQFPINSLHQFPSLTDEIGPDNKRIELSAGLGLVTFKDDAGLSWFKGGHNEWTGNFVVCRDIQQRCVVLMANDVRAEKLFPHIVQLLWGKTGIPWNWEYDWYDPDRTATN